MQVILGSSGQIGSGLAQALQREFTREIRLVSRRPKRVNDRDQLHSADLLDAAQTMKAVEGAEIAYLTAGLPMDTSLWVKQWPVMMQNVIAACATTGCKLVYFDNTYMYPQTCEPQTESTAFKPSGDKGRVRAAIVANLLAAIARGQVQGMVCRAPEFYGPANTQSLTNRTVIERLRQGKAAQVLLRDDRLRSLIFAPDASRALAHLGNATDAYGQTWHLPCDDQRLTYRQFVALAAEVFGCAARYRVVPAWQLHLAGLASAQIRDAAELLPRYAVDNIFVSDKFKQRFPQFGVTSYRAGLQCIAAQGLTRC